MTVVYLDVLFLLNLVVDYLLLLASAKITGETFSRLRLAMGAVLGAAYAAIIFLPDCQWLVHPVCKICAEVAMVLAAFWRSHRLLRLVFVCFGVSAALGGVVLGLQLLGTGGLTLENGVLYTGFDLRLLLVTVIITYVVLSLVFGKAARHGGGGKDLRTARLTLWGRSVALTVLLDTGNTLTDPVQNQPVMVVEGRAIQTLLPEDIDLNDPVGTLERMNDREQRRKFSLLPYRAVGVEYGMLLAVRMDQVVLSGKERGRMLVALSPTPVSDGGGYQALYGEL